MSNEDADVFANRGTPIPVVSITSPGDQSRPSLAETTGDSRHRLSASKLKDKLQSLGDSHEQAESPNRFSDKMFTMYVLYAYLSIPHDLVTCDQHFVQAAFFSASPGHR